MILKHIIRYASHLDPFKMMSSNVAKWCHHIATSQQRGEIVFHVVIFRILLFTVYKYWSKILKKSPYFRNGAERSGLFCVALYVAQQIKTQQKVDIFSAVKHVRLYRPQCIANMVRIFWPVLWIWQRPKYVQNKYIFSIFLLFQEQYIFLYEFAQEYIARQN